MITDRLGFLILAGAGLLTACETPNPIQTFPQLSFAGQKKILLNVASIEVIDDYRMPLKPPYVEHRAPINPSAAIERWAADVLQAVGSEGKAVLRITDGSLMETPLQGTEGLKGLVTTDQTERYDTSAAAVLEIYNGGGVPMGQAEAKSTRFQTVEEGISLNQRERVWYRLVEDTVLDFSRSMEVAIRTYLTAYVR